MLNAIRFTFIAIVFTFSVLSAKYKVVLKFDRDFFVKTGEIRYLGNGKIFNLDKEDGSLYLAFTPDGKKAGIKNLTFNGQIEVPLKEFPERAASYRLLPVKRFQNRDYLPVSIFPLKKKGIKAEAPKLITFVVEGAEGIPESDPEKLPLAIVPEAGMSAGKFEGENIRWYVFSLTEEGIYKIGSGDAENWGIENANPENLHFFTFNGQMFPFRTNTGFPSEMKEIPVRITNHVSGDGWKSDEIINLYLRGADFFYFDSSALNLKYQNHFYSEVNYLWLMVDETYSSPRIEPENISEASETFDYAVYREHFERDEVNRLKSGTTWFENARNINDNPFNIQFSLFDEALCTSCPDPSLSIKLALAGGNRYLWGDVNGFYQYFDFSLKDGTRFIPLYNNYRITNAAYRIINLNYALSGKPENPTLQIEYTPVPLSSSGSVEQGKYFFDYYELSYPVRLGDYDRQYAFYHDYGTGAVEFDFGSNAAGNEIWNVTNAFSPGVSLIAGAGKAVPVFRENYTNIFIYHKPGNSLSLSAPQVLDYAFHLRDASTRADMIIITPEKFYEAAEAYAAVREEWSVTPFKCQVVTVEDIFREFSAGVKDPGAIRNFLKFAWEEREYRPSFAFLVGDGNYDPRGLIFSGNDGDFIPTFQIDAMVETSSYTTDYYYADLNVYSNDPNSLEPEIPIGRLPASSVSQIENYRDKLEHYAQTDRSNGWEEDILLIADDLIGGDNTNEIFHFQGAESIARQIPSRYNLYKLYMEMYPAVSGGIGRIKPQATRDFLNRVNQGQSIVIYIGHGAPDKWAHETLYDLTLHRTQVQNDYKNGLWMALSCDISKFDDPGRATMGEDLILREKSGALWVFAPARLVLAYQNNALGTKIMSWLVNKSSKYTVGKAVNLAVQEYATSNTLKYILFGDPSLSLLDGRIPMTIDNVSALDTLKALQKVTFSGEIGDGSGDYSADAVMRVYDAVDTLYYPYGTSSYIPFYVQGASLYKGQMVVENARFSATFIVPKSIKYSALATGKIWLYAWNSQIGLRASGSYPHIVFYGSAGNINDDTGPVISLGEDGINSFLPGAIIPNDAELKAHISDDSGINLSGETGHELSLVINEEQKIDLSEFFVYERNSATEGNLVYPLATLSPGENRLKLKVWDNVNNPSEVEFTVEIVEKDKIVLQNVVNYPNPMREETWFTFQTTASSGKAEVEIFNLDGRKLRTLSYGLNGIELHKIHWDGRDRNGNSLANGTYLYKLTLASGERKLSKIEKLVILR
jgi:hypothetical protein